MKIPGAPTAPVTAGRFYQKIPTPAPQLGILAADGQTMFRGNRENFADIAKAGERRGVSVLILTPRVFFQPAPSGLVQGFCLQPNTEEWLPVSSPLPRVIYNRLPNRRLEQQPRTQRILRYLNKAPGVFLFNPGFFDKWSIHQKLLSSHTLRCLVPETSRLSLAALQKMFRKYTTLYIKPIEGRAGIHLMRAQKLGSGYELIHQLKRRRIRQRVPSIASLWLQILQQQCARPSHYLVQRGINLARYGGRPFDIRTLVQKNGRGRWEVTGSGVRVAGVSSISTHVPRGGKIAPLPRVFGEVFGKQANELSERINSAALSLAYHIERQEGLVIGEMSIDWGIESDGKLWFFEANAKPMKFDEPAIRHRSLQNLIEYAIYLNKQLGNHSLKGEEEPCG